VSEIGSPVMEFGGGKGGGWESMSATTVGVREKDGRDCDTTADKYLVMITCFTIFY
jgi:hypothetical protein